MDLFFLGGGGCWARYCRDNLENGSQVTNSSDETVELLKLMMTHLSHLQQNAQSERENGHMIGNCVIISYDLVFYRHTDLP